MAVAVARLSDLSRLLLPPPQSLDGSAELGGVDAGVELGGVEVLVAEQFLDLAEVGAGGEELGGEDVAEGVGG